MNNIITNTIRRMAENMQELSIVDEDYGQLETSDDTYPDTFPALLISTPKIEWSDQGKLCQCGLATMEIRLVLDCYDDTHYGSTTESKAQERMDMYVRMNRLLHGWRPDEDCTALIRTSSIFETIGGGKKIYGGVYSFEVYYYAVDDVAVANTPRPRIQFSRLTTV